jgi:hypothetical protein
MQSTKERIRKAINKALKRPVENVTNLEPIFDEAQANASLEMIQRGELPNRIVAKIPDYITFINDFIHVFATGDKDALIELVLANKNLVYYDIDFTLYVTFITKRYEMLGETEQAKAMPQLLKMVHEIGLFYG